MKITKMSEGITQLSVNIDDILFEGLWEMPNGVTLNSYVVQGEKIALIDGVCGWDGVPESLFDLLDQLNIDLKSIQYLILNHLEPDHAGWIEDLRKIHEDFEIICTDKGADLFQAFFGPGMNIRVVKDGDSVDLGNGKVLTFTTIPHVHWPDAMVTLEQSSGTLFSCDAFGTFGTFEKSSFDDDYSDEEMVVYERDTIRYYSNIIAAFSPFVLKAAEKLKGLSIKTIAPGHGLIWRSRVSKIIQDYVDYAIYQKGDARKEVTLIWGSMYGMTGKAADAVIEELKASGVKYHVHQVPETSWGEILTSVWTSSAVILGMPTYEYKMFPPMASILEELGKKKVHGRKAFRFGSYGWSGGAQKELDEISQRFRWGWSFVDPHEFKGNASPEDLRIIRERVSQLIEMI
ncbi:MAG: FprA family A-type flavoprotein [Bacillota bacterium]|nr:FprA family A-type flavoprotein [Bacillota bacterium]